jgi:hypothetical protein
VQKLNFINPAIAPIYHNLSQRHFILAESLHIASGEFHAAPDRAHPDTAPGATANLDPLGVPPSGGSGYLI